MERKRRHFTPEEKVSILRRHLLDKEPVSELCDELGLQPTVFYQWQKRLFEQGAAAFTNGHPKKNRASDRKIESLEEKLQRKNEVLSELMEEHVKLKKTLGES
jgi:transposase